MDDNSYNVFTNEGLTENERVEDVKEEIKISYKTCKKFCLRF